MNESLEIRPVVGTSLSEVRAIANIFWASGYFTDIRDEAQAVTKILYGREMGFTPIISMMGIYIIEGKPSLSANLLSTLIKRSGKYDYRLKENTSTRCAILFRQRDDSGKWEDLGETEFTIEEARQAKLKFKTKSGDDGMWVKYPKAMLFARALSAGVRVHCPDVTICPLYVPEELGAEVNGDGEPTNVTPSAPSAPVIQGERTSEPRTFTAPTAAKQDSAGSNSGQGAPTSEGLQGPEPAKTADAAGVGTGIPAPAKPDSKELPGCITKGEAANFEREFKNALKKEHQKNAKQFSHDWLKMQGFVVEGEPTAYAIPKIKFYDIREEALKFARSL